MTIHYLGLLSRFVDVLELMHLIYNYIIDHSDFFASLKFNGDISIKELCSVELIIDCNENKIIHH